MWSQNIHFHIVLLKCINVSQRRLNTPSGLWYEFLCAQHKYIAHHGGFWYHCWVISDSTLLAGDACWCVGCAALRLLRDRARLPQKGSASFYSSASSQCATAAQEHTPINVQYIACCSLVSLHFRLLVTWQPPASTFCEWCACAQTLWLATSIPLHNSIKKDVAGCEMLRWHRCACWQGHNHKILYWFSEKACRYASFRK